MQNYVIFVFFRKKFISKDMKAIKYKMKKLNRFVHSSKRSPWELQLSKYVLRLQKERQIWQKSRIHLPFLWKTHVEASKFITYSLKTSDFVTLISLTRSFDKE